MHYQGPCEDHSEDVLANPLAVLCKTILPTDDQKLPMVDCSRVQRENNLMKWWSIWLITSKSVCQVNSLHECLHGLHALEHMTIEEIQHCSHEWLGWLCARLAEFVLIGVRHRALPIVSSSVKEHEIARSVKLYGASIVQDERVSWRMKSLID